MRRLNRRQLRIIIEQEASKKQLTKDAVDGQILKTLGDEGGASGLEPIEKGLKDLADEEGAELPPEAEDLSDYLEKVDGVKKHEKGDYIMTEVKRLIRRSLRRHLL